MLSLSRAGAALCCALLALSSFPPPLWAAAALTGKVVDAETGLALPNAIVQVVGTSTTATADAGGTFIFATLPPGRYQLHVEYAGYQPGDSTPIQVGAAASTVTLALQRAANNLHVIAVASARSSDALQKSSTFFRSLDTENLLQNGTERAADALRLLPGVNNGITGDSAALADDVNLNIRGIGTLETEATLDGHPIAFGFPGGYNYQLSPVFGLRNISVIYGSGGTALTGVDAIGGVIDFQTLDPTPTNELSFMQGYGTFQQYTTALRATGTDGRLGYAIALGVNHLDGPIHNDYFFQPGAAYDQSAPVGSSVYNLGVYRDDSTAVTRSALAKFSYELDNVSSVTFTNLNSDYWNDKTGNGDGDYLAYGPALAFGEHLLTVKPGSDACPTGTFTATNANGKANGTGPNGSSDGGIKCQTPQQYAQFNTGWQGAGPSWQSFNFNDYDLAYTHNTDRATVQANMYIDRYFYTQDRTDQLPFKVVPNDRRSTKNRNENETGFTISDQLHGPSNDFGFGLSYMNDAFLLLQNSAFNSALNTYETAFFLADAYHPRNSRFTAYLNTWFKHASATNTAYVNPRLSVVYDAGKNDVVRAAIGKTTTQPSADQLGKAYVEATPGGAGGGSAVNCGGLNSVGTAPSSVLQPESGVDEEVAYGHRFHGDSQVQLSLYNVNVFQKLYSTLVPLSTTGTGFIDRAFLANAEAIVASRCGSTNALALLGVSGTFNVGQLQARGFTLDGRQRLSKSVYVDYDWDTTSTVLKAAPAQLLKSNLTFIPGDQLPRLPLHTLNVALDATTWRNIDLRYTYRWVSINNTKTGPAYTFSDLQANIPVHRSGFFGDGTLAVNISNLFNQGAFIQGLRYEGVPLALNAYATAASYAPVTGANVTELFGLPYRSIYFSYTWRIVHR